MGVSLSYFIIWRGGSWPLGVVSELVGLVSIAVVYFPFFFFDSLLKLFSNSIFSVLPVSGVAKMGQGRVALFWAGRLVVFTLDAGWRFFLTDFYCGNFSDGLQLPAAVWGGIWGWLR